MSTQKKKTPAASTATDVQLLREGELVHSTTGSPASQVTGHLPAMKKQLTSLVYYYAVTGTADAHRPQPMDETIEDARPAFRLVKVFGDGSDEPVPAAKIDVAVQWVASRGWKAWGYWINGSPALAWARLPEDFTRTWGYREPRAPCRYASAWNARARKGGAYINSFVKVGKSGYIFPTRSRRQVFELRSRFSFYCSDLLFVPIEVLVVEQKEHKHVEALLMNAAVSRKVVRREL